VNAAGTEAPGAGSVGWNRGAGGAATLEGQQKARDRIVASELPGVLNRALEGYRRLVGRGGFKIPSAVKIATTRWLRHANPLPAFIEACCVKHPEAECRLADFYAAYAVWVRRMGYAVGPEPADREP
jgi:phage/plasmid-associated DNA primase